MAPALYVFNPLPAKDFVLQVLIIPSENCLKKKSSTEPEMFISLHLLRMRMLKNSDSK